MSEEGAAKPVRRFRVWIRRRVDPQGPYAIRFEVTDGKGILRVARPGVLIDPPARPAGVEERLTAAQVRSSRFLHVWDGGRYRQGHLLARLEEGLIDALPAERWVELVPEMDSNTAMLVLPKVLRPDNGRVDDEPTWPRREGADATRSAETVRVDDPPPASPAPSSSHDAPDSRRAQPAPRPLGRADAPPVPARGFETWDLGPPMVGGDPDAFDDEHTVLMRSVVPPVAPVTRPATTPGASAPPKPSATPAAHASPPPSPRAAPPTPPLILPPLPAASANPDEEMTTLEVSGALRIAEDDAEMAAFTIDDEPLEAHPGDEDDSGREAPRVVAALASGEERAGRHDLVRGQISGAVTFLPGERPEVEVEVLESLEAGDDVETVEDVDDPWGASVRAEPARGPSVPPDTSAPPASAPAPAPAPQAAPEAPLALHERNTTLVRFLRRRIAADRVRILALESRIAQLEAQVAGRPASEG